MNISKSPAPSIFSSKITKIAFFASAILILGCGKGEDKTAAAPAPLSVKVAKSESSDLPITMEFVGELKGSVDAEIRARVEGVLTGMHFEEGKEVEEGQLLYTIDEAPFKAKVAEVEARVSEAKTKLVKAESDLKRVEPLVKIKALSERDLDLAVANRGVAQGGVDAAMASLDSAKIELGYCKITSPTKGVIGLSKAKVGEFVGRAPNPVVLNTVSKLDPINVRFSVNEKEYLYFSRIKQKEVAAGIPENKRKLELVLSDNSVHSEAGEVSSINREIDPKTGTMTVEASFPNPLKLLRPGQFGKVRAVAETVSGAVTVPKRAILDIQGQTQVFVVGEDNVVQSKTVKLGRVLGDKQVIEEGLSAGETVVTEGLQRVKSGATVTPVME